MFPSDPEYLSDTNYVLNSFFYKYLQRHSGVDKRKRAASACGGTTR